MVNGIFRKDATEVGKDITLDWGFMVETFKDSKIVQKLTGLHGETAHLIIMNQFRRILGMHL